MVDWRRLNRQQNTGVVSVGLHWDDLCVMEEESFDN